MGIAKGAAKVLLKEASRRPFKGRVLTLGRQDIWFSYGLLQKMAMEFGIELTDPGDISVSRKPGLAASGYISDDCLFTSLGFSNFKALDFSDYESAHYIFDLNSSKIPEHLLEVFDVIIDGGTIEHVFHIPNVLNNIHKMLCQGGRIIHLSPSSNHMDHGFYMFSPALFWDFYEANKFEINNFQLVRYTPRHHVDPWEITDYQPGCLDRISFGGLDDGMYGIICIATKTKHSTGDIVPQQLSCMYAWKTKDTLKDQKGRSETLVSYRLKFQMIKNAIKRLPFLYQILRHIVKFIRSVRRPRSKGLGLKIVARY